MAEYSFAMYFALAFAMYIDAKKKGVLLCIFFLDESEVKVQCLTHAPMQLLEFQTSLLGHKLTSCFKDSFLSLQIR